MGRQLARFAPSVFAVSLALAIGASPAAASVTIGQLAPGIAPVTCTVPGFDFLQPTVGSGNSYVVSGAGTLTSWTTNAAPDTGGPGQTLTMKIFRKVADPDVYTVVGHDGPRPLVPSLINTFPASVPVKPGDVLGLNDGNAGFSPNACNFVASGVWLSRSADLADGQSAAFQTNTDRRLNITATVVPSSAFTFGATRFSKKKGAATLTVNLPGPGDLSASGNGVKAASAGRAVTSKAVSAPGAAQLLIKAKGKKKRKLNDTGKVKLRVAVTYTPTGGDPATQSLKVKLKKK